MNRPISSGDFDPLRPPGSGNEPSSAEVAVFTAGQFVRAAMDNTAFFKNRPKGDGDADRLLARGTSMKVVSHSWQLREGGVGQRGSRVCSCRHAGGSECLTRPPPRSIPANSRFIRRWEVPTANRFRQWIPPALPPEGAIPTVIDPEAPSTVAPMPRPCRRLRVRPRRWSRRPDLRLCRRMARNSMVRKLRRSWRSRLVKPGFRLGSGCRLLRSGQRPDGG